jgi:hypothetical protein
MKITPSAITGILLAVLLLIFVLRVWVKGGILPPHEFAYGTALRDCKAIPERMDQFLSLDVIDPNETQIQTFVGNRSEKNLAPLITYISPRKDHDFGPMIAALKSADQRRIKKKRRFNSSKRLLNTKIC